MPSPRRVTLTAAVLFLAVSTTVGIASGAEDQRSAPQTRRLTDLERPAELALRAVLARGDDPATYIGIDGQVHTLSPQAVPGKAGYYFIGSDFDSACAFGARLRPALRRLSRLADILEKAGKRVYFTVTPNKSAVVGDKLPDDVPQGWCSLRGMRLQAKLLDRYRDPRYVPLRQRLARMHHAYWRTDTHWNTVGTSIFAERLASALDPRLAAKLKYKRTERTHLGDFSNFMAGLSPETGPARLPSNGVVTRPARGSVAYDPSLAAVYTDLSWVSKPARRTYPGRTLILGDSFTYTAFEALTNLFRKGRFIWVGTQDGMDQLASAVNKADTVIFSVVQRFATVTQLVDREFQDRLKSRLQR